jgi:hypothetical protein
MRNQIPATNSPSPPQPIAAAISQARTHWKMLRRRRAHPQRIERARRSLAALVQTLQSTR